MKKSPKSESLSGFIENISLVSTVDFLGFIGFVIAWIALSPQIRIWVDFSLMFYFLCRFLFEKSNIMRVLFLGLTLFVVVSGIFTLFDQSSLIRIDAALSDTGKQYYTNDEITASDFAVTAHKKNGKELPVDVFDFSPSSLIKGKNIVAISYKGLQTNIAINAIDPYIEYLEITPVKKDFYVGDKLSKKDFNVVGVDSKGNRSVIIDYTFSSDEILSEGTNTFSFVYEVASGTVTINAKKHEITLLEVTYTGKDPLYKDDTINADNLDVIGVYDNGIREKILDFKIENPELKTIGDNKINITYNDLSAYVIVTAHGIVSIEAEFTNSFLFEGDNINKNDFIVNGVYDNNDRKVLSDFLIEFDGDENSNEEMTAVAGENNITIKWKDIATELVVTAYESPSSSVSMSGEFHYYYIDNWDEANDFDINGSRHKKGGKRITLTDIWHQLDPNGAGSSEITMTWFIPLTPNQSKSGSTFSGVFVLEHSMKDNSSSGEVTIKAGNKEYTFGPLDSSHMEPIPFSVNIENLDSIEIIAKCTVNKASGFVFGLLNE